MKLENSKRDFIREGSEETTKMSISADVESHIIKVLTEHSYDDPLGSSIRECVSNAVDSVMEAGTKEPVIVSLQKNKAGQHELTIEDFGLGLDDASFKKYIMGLGESTKRNNDMLLGGYGAGAKAWLAYTDSFTYTCFKDGVERKYLIFKGEEFPECSLIHEKPTTRKNGVIVTVQLKSSWLEVSNCEKKIKEQLAYLDNVYYNIPNFKNTYKIHRGPCFQFSDLLVEDCSEMHISLKNIRYPIDWAKIGMSRIALPIALRFDDYDSIKPIFNRESIQYNSTSIRAIKAKIQEVAEWFGKKWDSEVSEFDNFRKARLSICNYERPVTVSGRVFNAKDFFKEMNIKTKVPVVKGLVLRDAKFYADLGDSILNRWEPMGLDQNGTWKKAHIKYEYQRCALDIDDSSWKKCIIVLVNESITGYLKDYLREKYPSKGERVFYVQRDKPFARKMGTIASTSSFTYEGLCKLGGIPEDQWQPYIDELELVLSHYEATFHNEMNIKGTKAFQDFVDNRRAQIKAGTKPKPTGAYIALDKQKGEVTVYKARMAKVGWDVVYEKDKEKIEDLRLIKKDKWVRLPTVYWPTTQDNLDEAFVKPFMDSFNFIRVNQTELKHFQSIKHFMSKEKFMEAKPLARLATAILIDQILDLEPNNTDMIDLTSKEMMRVRNKLIEYKKAHLETVGGKINSKIKEVILQDAKDRNHWDRTIYADAVAYKEKLKPYMFLSLLKDTDSWRTSDEEKLAIKNLTYVMLKHNKITHKQLDQFELVPKVTPMVPSDINDLQFAVA